VLHHNALIDPDDKYLPYSEHELEREVVQKADVTPARLRRSREGR
jgi:hypothetical protein